jgi:hypothetical protein
MGNHRYPGTRKKRSTKYSMTYKILNEIGKDKLFEIWVKNGHRRTSFILSEMLNVWVSPMVIQYIAARKFFWQRIVTDRSLPIYLGILSGKTDPKKYPTIIFQ